MAGRIPATVITGFLGAGKTTLIRNLLAQSEGLRIALIVNEFGDVGVDGETLSDCGVEGCEASAIVELANGCICCTVADDFIPTMEMLLTRDPPPDHIVIETSGLALPQPLVQAFNWPEVKTRVTVDGVVTVVDAPAVAAGQFAANVAAVQAQREADDMLGHENPLHELFEDQIGCADLVVLNKTDLLDETQLQDVEALIVREKRPAARIVRSVLGKLPGSVVVGLNIGAEDDMTTRKSHHDGDDHEPHDHDDFDSFVLDVPALPDAAIVSTQIEALMEAHGILRAKGFLAIQGKPMRLAVQAVGPRVDTYFDRPWRTDETIGGSASGQLVVIGLKGLDREAVRQAFSRAVLGEFA